MKNRSQLENILLARWQENERSQPKYEAMVDFLHSYQVDPGLIGRLISSATPVEMVSDELLCVLAMATQNVFDCDGCSPNRFFTDIEISTVKGMTFEPENDIDGDIRFNNVLCVRLDHYLTVISSQYLKLLLNSGHIIYRPETQRGMTIKQVADSIIKKFRINTRSVSHIAEMIVNKRYEPTTLTINVYSDDLDACIFNSRNRTLIIKDGVEVDMIDGLHRTYGTLEALMDSPNIQQPWELRIVHWSIPRAKLFIRQEDYKTPLTKEVRVSMDQNDLATQVVTMLNEAMYNEMQGRIATDTQSVLQGRSYTLFSIMVDAVRDFFKPKYQRDVSEISNYLVSFYNALIPLIQNRDGFIHYYLFYGYILLAEYFNRNKISLEELSRIIDALIEDPINDTDHIKSMTSAQRKIIKEWIDRVVI